MNIFSLRNVHTNIYGLARTLLAISLLTTLVFTDNHRNFPVETYDVAANNLSWNYFMLLGYDNLDWAVVGAVVVLLWVISGYLPQVSSFLHCWIAISYFDQALIVEGGDQIAQILALLIIPMAVTDPRLNHWFSSDKKFFKERSYFLKYFAYSCVVIVQIQMCILYLFAFVEKFGVEEWKNGSAFYYWFNHTPFGATSFFHFLFDWAVNSPLLGRIITWGVLVFESVLFAAMFMDKRRRLLPWALAFHFSIVLIHGLGSFFFAMAAGLVLYLYPVDREFQWQIVKKKIPYFRFSWPDFDSLKAKVLARR